MKRLLRLIPLLVIVGAIGATYWYTSRPPTEMVLTGVVTTNHITVSPQITGRLTELQVREGDVVKAGQMLAVLAPDELREERAFYLASAEGVGSQVQESEAALRLQERQTVDSIAQAEATLASTQSQEAAAKAELENAAIVYQRNQKLSKEGVATPEQVDSAKTAYDVAKSRLESVGKQIEAARAAVALAKGSAEQIAMRRSQCSPTASNKPPPRRSAPKPTCGSPIPRSRRRSTASSTCVRAARRGRDPRATGRHHHQSRRSLGPRRSRGNLHRPCPQRRHADGAAPVRGRAAGKGVLSRRRRRLRDAARRQPHEARHQDVRDPVRVDNSDRRLAVGMSA